MDKIDKLFYINLFRRPDRNEHFLLECAKANIPPNKIERYEAVDGKKLENEIPALFRNADYINEPFVKNIIGNQLSHYNILQEMVKREYNHIIICQDDVIFKNGFLDYLEKVVRSIPENAEIVNIGFHKCAIYAYFEPWDLNDVSLLGVPLNDNICNLHATVNPCSLAYIVTRQGAINLLEYFNKTGFLRATDHNYNDYLLSKNIFYGSIPVICTGNPALGSDIF
jgi:GR25 family glycosyltransferase involved in LPS biosynthesis